MTAPAVDLRTPEQLPGVSRQTATDLVERIRNLYADAETRLAADMARRLAAGMDRQDWAARKLEQAAAMRANAERILARLASDSSRQVTYAVVSAYMRGGQDAQRALVQLGMDHIDPFPTARVQKLLNGPESMLTRSLTELAHAFPAAGAMMRLAGALVLRMTGTHLPVLRWAEDAYRKVISETALSDVAGGLATRRVASQRAWSRLLNDGITGFTDRAGRNWNLASYVEMATRTGVAQAAVEGHLDRLGEAGLDLVIVSNAPQECERCRPWEGKVLERHGADGRHTVEAENVVTGRMNKIEVAGSVDEAIRKGLMHPNCRHSLNAYLHGATKPPTNTEDPEGDAARQRLRELERNVRREKLKAAAAIDPEAAKAHERKARGIQGQIRDHVAATKHLGIFRKREREQLNLGNTHGGSAGTLARQPEPTPKPAPPQAPAPRRETTSPALPVYGEHKGVSPEQVANLRAVLLRSENRVPGDFFSAWAKPGDLDTLAKADPVVRSRIQQEIKIDKSFQKFKKKQKLGNVPDSELKADLAARAKEAFAGKPIGIRIDADELSGMLREGRYKSQFETGTSSGGYDPTKRAHEESVMFGLPLDLDPKLRPIYGYLSPEGKRAALRMDDDALTSYGDVAIYLKREVRRRTTAMVGDSLDDAQYGRPSAVDDPEWRSFSPAGAGSYNPVMYHLDRDYASTRFRKNGYIEAQIHGGVTVEDIDEVVFMRKPGPDLIALLKAHHVSWRVGKKSGKK